MLFRSGSKVFLTGEVRIREYKKQDGTTGMSVDLLVNNFEFLDSANGNSNSNGGGYQNNANNGSFNSGQQQSNTFTSGGYQNGTQGSFNVNNNALEISDSDIPF